MWPIIGVSWSGSISHISSWQEKNIYIQQSCWVTSKALHVIGSIINLSSFITVLVAECCRLFAPEAFTKWYAMISKSLLNLVLMSQHSINTNDFIWFPDTSRMSCWGWRHVIRRKNHTESECSKVQHDMMTRTCVWLATCPHHTLESNDVCRTCWSTSATRGAVSYKLQ